MSAGKKREREFTGRHMLVLLLAFFGVVVAVNVTMAVLAGNSWTGLLARNGYVASQDYNNVLADARRQQELGWRSTLDAGAQGISLAIRDRDGKPVSGLSVEAYISRPTHERDDRTIALAERGAGNYLAEEALAPGAWKIEIQAQDRAGRPYRRQFRIVRPGPR